MHDQHEIKLPLDRLIARLRGSGFKADLRTRLKIQQALHRLGHKYLDRPQDLGLVLGPLVAKTPAEQVRFQTAFQAYFAELRLDEVEEEAPQPASTGDHDREAVRPKPKWPRNLRIYGLGVAAAAILIFLLYPEQSPPEIDVAFEAPERVIVGEEVEFTNLTPVLLDDATMQQYDFTWQIDSSRYEQLHAAHTFSNPGSRTVVFSVRQKNGDATGSVQKLVTAECSNQPQVQFVDFPSDTLPDVNLRFAASVTPSGERFNYSWDFGDGTTSELANPSHTYAQAGTYTVRLNISRVNREGACDDAGLSRSLTIKDTRIQLTEKQLLPTGERIVSRLSSAFLLGFVLVCVCGYAVFEWRRHLQYRTFPEKLIKKFKPSDKPPYAIPFPKQDDAFVLEPSFYAFADSLRQRQEGERKVLDVPATLRATVKRAGFAQLCYNQSSKPAEYLFLIDEVNPDNQQFRLFEQLAQQLEREDVLVDYFAFRRDPTLVWNAKHADGLTIAQLHQLFPEHRLVIFGDGEYLVNPFSGKLGRDTELAFNRWPKRALLTPVPAEQWSHREMVLQELFTLLPSNIYGHLALVDSLHGNAVDDFKSLREGWRRQARGADRVAAAGQRITFKRRAELEAFLPPELFQWIAACTVYPQPTWEILLAIGDALAPLLSIKGKKGLVTYENIYLLSHIAWLQTGDIPKRLRNELQAALKELSPEIERSARQAVLAVLNSARDTLLDMNEDSQAAAELDKKITLQRASLDENDSEAQQELRFLLMNDEVDQRFSELLNQKKEAHFSKVRTGRRLIAGFGILVLLAGLLSKLNLPDSDLNAIGLTDKVAMKGVQDSTISSYNFHAQKYNAGVANYRESQMQAAIDDFMIARDEPRLRDDANHAIGLAIFYLGDPDSAASYIRLLSNSFWAGFGTPNLATLLGSIPPDAGTSLSGAVGSLAGVPLDSLISNSARVFTGHSDEVNAVAFSPDDTRLVSGSDDQTVRVWDLKSGKESFRFRHTEQVFAVTFSPDGRLIASGWGDGTVQILNGQSGQQMAQINADAGQVRAVAFSPDGRWLATGDTEDNISVWDVSSFREIAQLKGHSGDVFCLAFSPDGRLIASGSEDYSVRIWDAGSWQQMALLEGYTGSVYGVAFSPDGLSIVSGSGDRIVRIWNVVSGAEITRIDGHDGTVWSVAVSPDGRYIASGAEDSSVRIWAPMTGESARLSEHRGGVWSIDFSSDGLLLASGSRDGTIRLWNWRKDLTAPSGQTQDIVQADTVFLVGRDPAQGVTFATWQRAITFSNVRLNGELTTGQTVTGDSFTIGFDWEIKSPESPEAYCPTCVIQWYFGIKNQFSKCFASGVFQPGRPTVRGSVLETVAAPEQGVYYITLANTLDYSCKENPGRHSDKFEQAFARIDVSDVRVSTPPDIPEPVKERFYRQDKELLTIPLTPEHELGLTRSREENSVAATWNKCGRLLQQLAFRIRGIDEATLLAAWHAAPGRLAAGLESGRLNVRFRVHIFWTFWGMSNPGEFDRFFRFRDTSISGLQEFRPDEKSPWLNIHGNFGRELEALAVARRLDDRSALLSTAMGAQQVDGRFYALLGYQSPQAMFDNFSTGMRYQILAFFDYLDQEMILALQERDFERFARLYRGPANAENDGRDMAQAYDIFRSITGGDADDIASKVIGITANILGLSIGDFDTNAALDEDLGADDIDRVELVLAIEEQFKINIADDVATGFRTVGDIVAYITSVLQPGQNVEESNLGKSNVEPPAQQRQQIPGTIPIVKDSRAGNPPNAFQGTLPDSIGQTMDEAAKASSQGAGFETNPLLAQMLEQRAFRLIGASEAIAEADQAGEIKVAVLSTGVPGVFPFENKLIPGPNFVRDGVSNTDSNGHASSVSAIIAALAPTATIYAIKILNDDGSSRGQSDFTSAFSQAVNYAIEQDMQVMVLAFGPLEEQRYDKIVYSAREAGILPIWAIGNNSTAKKDLGIVENGAMAIAASTDNDLLWSNSNYGPQTSLTAPGVNITTMDINGRLTRRTGSSLATAIVSGVASLVWSVNPDLNAADVMQVLMSTAVNIDSKNPRYVGMMGSGRIDALAAIRYATSFYGEDMSDK